MQRAQRKLEHIKYALELGDGPAQTHLNDLRFLHNWSAGSKSGRH